MYDHIDTGKRFNNQQDRMDPTIISTRTEDHSVRYTGCSLDDFNDVNRDKNSFFKTRFALVFKKWPYKNFKDVFLDPISAICATIYQGKVLLICIFSQLGSCSNLDCKEFIYICKPKNQVTVREARGRLEHSCSKF